LSNKIILLVNGFGEGKRDMVRCVLYTGRGFCNGFAFADGLDYIANNQQLTLLTERLY
jgi:hypothetical protein